MTILNMVGWWASWPKVPLNAISVIAAVWWNTEATITWTDPSDLVVNWVTVTTWTATKLVRKVGSAPVDSTDWTLVVTETFRDTYSVSWYNDTWLTNGTTYYYAAFAVWNNWLETISSTAPNVTPVGTKEWDLSKITLDKSYNVWVTSIYWAYIDPSWTRLYINRESSSIMQRTLSTPRDVSTATGSSSLSVSISWQGIWLSNDGTLLFIFAYNGNVYKFTLSTPRDITTATQTQNINAAHGWKNPTWWIMSTDGKYMYTCYENNVIKLFFLSTPFDLSTASAQWTISSWVWTTRWLWISDDYKHIYGGADSKMWQIDLQAPHDLNNFTVQSKTMSPWPNNFYFGGGLVNSNNLLLTTDGKYVRTWNIV